MNDLNEWKVRIYEDGATGKYNFFIISNGTGNIRSYVTDAKLGNIGLIQEGESLSPTFTLSKGMMQALFTALQGQGMKPIEQSFVEGKLEATKDHLEDMRTLLKLKKGLYD